jgi:F-type H+-transporting ATPase subunit b
MLDISPIVMLIEAGIFFITLILLNMWLFQPLLSFMDRREAKLKNELKTASSNSEEAQKYEEEIASIIEKARAEASKMKKEALDKAKKEATQLVDSEVSKIEAAKTAFNEELNSKKVELMKVLETESVMLKDMLSKKLKGIA